MNTRDHFRVSVNTALLNKPDETVMSLHSSKGWATFELAQDELIESIKMGNAFAPEFAHEHRKSRNFVSANFLAADCDGTMTVTEARDHAFINTHASFIYTTPSHTDAEHRFRVVFHLENPITDGRDWANALFGLAHKLGTDSKVADAARCFFGSSNAQVWTIGRTLPAEKIAELIEYGATLREARAEGVTVDSTTKMATNAEVVTALGSLALVEQLPAGTSIHCPHHDDQRPSAFVVESQTLGGKGIHCRACGVTYWPAHADEYDFDAFDRMVERGDAEPQIARENQSGLSRFFPPEPIIKHMIERFLPPIIYAPGITLVKSPKGSGKTQMLATMISDIANGLYSNAVQRKDRVRSIVLIGHRRALIREAANKLGLEYYMEKGLQKATDGVGRIDTLPLFRKGVTSPSYLKLNTLAVCLDSLPKWNEPYPARAEGRRVIFAQNDPHDLVIIDESEQVLRHLLGKTIEAKSGGAKRVYDALKYEIENAKAVIALDADLGMLTTDVLRHLRPQDWQSRTRIFYNGCIQLAVRRQLKLYTRETALREELIAAILDGKRCFVSTNSKQSAKVLAKILAKRCGEKIKMKVVTSDNSTNPDEIEFVKNIREEILKLQVLICSPSLGTGIDITFPNGACRVDEVYGFFYAKVNTHTDIDQQLARVRNPGDVKVWVSPARFRYSSNFDVVRDDLARAYRVPGAVKGRDMDGLVDYNPHDPLLLISTHITASERASKNRLVDLFVKLRQANGWDIVHVDAPPVPNEDRSNAEKALWNENADVLLSAARLDDEEFFDLLIRREKGTLTPVERAQYERGHIERALGVPLTYAIIKLNYDGKLIERVGTFAKLLKHGPNVRILIDDTLKGQELPLDRLIFMPKDFLIACIGALIGMASSNVSALRDLQVKAEGLESFVELCLRNRTMIEVLRGCPLRSDIKTNPVRQLNEFLRHIGLKLESPKRVKRSGKTTRTYAFEGEKFDLMMDLASRFTVPETIMAEARQWDWDRQRVQSLLQAA